MDHRRFLFAVCLLLAFPRAGMAVTQQLPDNAPVADSPQSADVLLRTESGELVPLNLGKEVVDELLQRMVDQESIPRYTIDRIEMTGRIDKDEVRLTMEMSVSVVAGNEWVTVPVAMGDVYVEEFRSRSEGSGEAILAIKGQNVRVWHLKGAGLHVLTMNLVGKARQITPGVQQLNLTLPNSTASPHAVLSFGVPVELQKLPTGAVQKLTRDAPSTGVTAAEFWLSSDFSLSWAEVVPRVATKPLIQVQNRMKLDLTTIPGTLSGTQQLQISGSPISELTLSFPVGFQLQELDARNTAGVSVLQNFETSVSSPGETVVRLTAAIEETLTITYELALANSQFPQDIRITVPAVRDANVQSGDLDMLFPTGLLIRQTDLKDVQRRRVTSEVDASVAATAFRLRSPESQVQLHIEETVAQFAVSPEVTVTTEAETVTAGFRYQVSVLKGTLLDLAVTWPGWSSGKWQILPRTLKIVSGKTSAPLSFQPSEEERDVLLMTFPERQSGEFFVEFDAFAELSAFETGEVLLSCPEIRARQGQPFLVTTIESDRFSIRPVNSETGAVLTAAPVIRRSILSDRTSTAESAALKSESWLHDSPATPLKLELTTQAPSVQSEIQLSMRPQRDGIEVQETIRFQIEHRDLAGLSLQVPESIRPVVRLEGKAEALRPTIEANSWTFRLPEPYRGELFVRISYLWSPGGDLNSGTGVLALPIVLPQLPPIRSIEAGADSLSGLTIESPSTWYPVFSEQMDRAWRTELPTETIPVTWTGRQAAPLFQSPDLLLVRTQIIGNQCLTTTVGIFDRIPEKISIETSSDLAVDLAMIGDQDLTKQQDRQVLRTREDAERNIVNWQIDPARIPLTGDSPVVVSFRVRDPLYSGALWHRRRIRRAVFSGEASRIPVFWFLNSGEGLAVTASDTAFSNLTQQWSFSLLRQPRQAIADRQLQAVFSAFPQNLSAKSTEVSDSWLAEVPQTSVFLGSGEKSFLTVGLTPKPALILVSAGICLLIFAVCSLIPRLPVMLAGLGSCYLYGCGWVVWPESAEALAPFAAAGALFGLIAVVLQKLFAVRHLRPVSAVHRELPSVFGYGGPAPSVASAVRDSAAKPASQPEFTLGSSG